MLIGIILSGGPSSVYEKDAPHADPKIWEQNIPVLGICYGLQEMVWALKGEVTPSKEREYGPAQIECFNNEGLEKCNSLMKDVTDFKVNLISFNFIFLYIY